VFRPSGVISCKSKSSIKKVITGNQYLISRDVCHITQGGVIQAQKLQGPLQLLERGDATLAWFNTERE